MYTCPILRSTCRIIATDPDFVTLAHGQGRLRLNGTIYRRLLPLLNGAHTVEQVVAALGDVWPRREVLESIFALHERALLDEAPPTNRVHEAAYAHHQGMTASDLADMPKSVRVRLVDFSSADSAPLVANLRAEGIRALDYPPNGPNLIALVDDYRDPRLRAFDEYLREIGTTWLIAKPADATVWVGPLFDPHTSPCWNCLATTLYTLSKAKPPQTPNAYTDLTLKLAYAALTPIVLRWLHGNADARLRDHILALDTVSMEATWHRLRSAASCDVCGYTPAPVPQKIALEPRPKTGFAEAGHRSLDAADFLDAYAHLSDPVMGIIDGMHRVGAHPLVHIYSAGTLTPPTDTPVPRARDLIQAAGKGRTATLAKASALGEAAERFSSIADGTEDVLVGTYNELRDRAIPPNTLTLYSVRQLGSTPGPDEQPLPVPFDPATPIPWCEVMSLVTAQACLVPAAYCYLRYDMGQPTRVCIGDTNGNAAGATVEEAILNGLFELVERDSVGIWWYNAVQRPCAELAPGVLPYADAMRTFYEAHGRDLTLLDLTTDLGIPVMAAVSARKNAPQQDIIMGYGCHIDPVYAAQRALTELNQSLIAVWSRTLFDNTDAFNTSNRRAIAWWENATLDENPHLVPNGQTDIASGVQRPDMLADLEWCIERFRSLGLDILVRNLTRPVVAMPVVKVMSPGLRHMRPRFAPGRLYTVPVALGWRNAPLAEADLNPTPLYTA